MLIVALGTGVEAAPKNGKFSVGVIGYTPSLDEVRKQVVSDGHGPLVDDSDRSIFVSLTMPDPKGNEGLWIDVYYSRYGGESTDNEFEIDVHNGGASYLILVPSDYVVPFGGVGANILYMRRHQEFTFSDDGITHNDWLWGLNAQAGICVAPLPWVGVEARYLYLWSRQSTLGGTEYDLGDSSVALTVSLMF